MFKEKKISRTFEKIRDNYLSSSDVDIVNQNKVTRLGIVTKIIFQLLVVCLFTMISWYSIPNLINFSDSQSLSTILSFLTFLSFLNFIIYIAGIYFVDISKICSFLFSIINGLLLGVCFCFLNRFYINFIFYVFVALFSTFFVFIFMTYLYYKGFLQATQSFKQKMFFIFTIVIICEIVRIFLFLLGDKNLTRVLSQSIVSIPISIFMIIFTSLILILHFDYLEQMMVNDMPSKYEWQICLGFVSLFISIFVRILDLLLTIFGRERD